MAGPKEQLLTCFLDGKPSTFRECLRLEAAGKAKVKRRGAGSVPADLGGGKGPWVEMESVN